MLVVLYFAYYFCQVCELQNYVKQKQNEKSILLQIKQNKRKKKQKTFRFRIQADCCF